MNGWAIVMIVAGGLFAGGAATFAWSRVPIWRRMPVSQFVGDFAQTLLWTDKVQPALLVVAIVSSLGFALSSTGSAAVVATAALLGFIVTLAGSLAILVPLQRRIIATSLAEDAAIEAMRRRWFRANLGRSAVATAAFLLVALAAAV